MNNLYSTSDDSRRSRALDVPRVHSVGVRELVLREVIVQVAALGELVPAARQSGRRRCVVKRTRERAEHYEHYAGMDGAVVGMVVGVLTSCRRGTSGARHRCWRRWSWCARRAPRWTTVESRTTCGKERRVHVIRRGAMTRLALRAIAQRRRRRRAVVRVPAPAAACNSQRTPSVAAAGAFEGRTCSCGSTCISRSSWRTRTRSGQSHTPFRTWTPAA